MPLYFCRNDIHSYENIIQWDNLFAQISSLEIVNLERKGIYVLNIKYKMM